MAGTDFLQPRQQKVLFGRAAFHLDDQHGLGIQRVAGVGEGFAGVDRGAVHELECDRDNAGGNDGIDAGAGDLVGFEGGEHGAGAFRAAQDADRDLGDDGQLALAAGEQAEPIIARGIQVGTANFENFALDGDDFQAEQVVGGDPVAQAMGAARVHADVAADHAGELAGGVGGVERTPALHCRGDADIGDSGLHGGAAVGVVDVQDGIHAHQAEDDAVGQRQGSAGKRGAGASGDHADAFLVAVRHDGGDLLGGFQEDDDDEGIW